MAEKMVKTKIKMSDGSFEYMQHPANWTDAQIDAAVPEMHAASSEQVSKEKPNVRSDIINSLSNAPGAIGDFILNLPGQVLDAAGQISTNPLRATENLGAGLLEGIKGGINIPSNIARYMQSRELGQEEIGTKALRDLIAKAHIPDTGLEKAILGAPQKGDEPLQALSSFLPFAKLGGTAKGLSGTARRAGAAAAYGVGQEQDPLQAALLGLGGEGLARGVQRLTKPGALLPKSLLSTEELEQAVQSTKGTETNLGDVIQNPFLTKRFEKAAHLPLSGAQESMDRNVAEITNRGKNILGYLQGNEEIPDISERLHTALKSAFENARTQKNKKFKTLNEAADQSGVVTSRSNLILTAQEKLAEIESDPHLEGLVDPKYKKILYDIANPKKAENEVVTNYGQMPLGKAGKPILNYLLSASKGKNKLQFSEAELTKALGKNAPSEKVSAPLYSLQKTDLLRGKLGKLSDEAYGKGEGELSNLYQSLKDAATKDINDTIDKSGIPKLKKLRNKAFDYYKKEYVPFRDKEIKKFTYKNGDPDVLMQHFLKKSKLSDRGNLLSKLTSKLSDKDTGLLAYSYFSNAIEDGQLNPIKFGKLYRELGEKQKNALLSKAMQKQLGDYSNLVEKNKKSFDIINQPKKGYEAFSQIPLKGMLTLALGGAQGGGALGGLPGAIAGGVGGALIPGLVSKPLVKALTNETLREGIVRRMIKAREKEGLPQRNIAPLVEALMQISQSASAQENQRRNPPLLNK